MALTPGFQLPFGLQPLNAVPADSWSGPYSGATEAVAIATANAAIPSTVRFQSMDVRLIVNGVAKKYWYRDGTSDVNLVEISTLGGNGGSDVSSLSANWQNTFTTVQGNSATWNGGGTDASVRALTGTWQNTSTSFSTQSANNLSVYSTVTSASANWQSTSTSYSSNSASFVTISLTDSKYVPLSGGTLTGTLKAPTLSATTLYGDGSNVLNVNASNITSGILSAARLPSFSGDVSVSTTNGSVSAKVVAIQGEPISTQTPINGQVLQWNGTSWTPGTMSTGGGGGGGETYYLNQGLSAQQPTTNLPLSTHQLGRDGLAPQTIFTSQIISQIGYSTVCGFVTDTLDPDITSIPGGIWDFNVWGFSNATSNNPTLIRISIYKYNKVATPTLISTSDSTTLTDSGVFIQHKLSCLVSQTSALSSDRIYVEINALASAANKTVTIGFGDSTPTHVHTTIPSVGGSGIVKVINGIFQTPASLLVNSDVASNADIDQSKINGLTDIASKTNTTYTTVQSNSAEWADHTDASVRALTGTWQNTSTSFSTQSANNLSVYSTVTSASANWEDTFTTVQSNSALWIDHTDTEVRALTSNWEDSFTTVQSNSASWGTGGSGITGDYLPLSGGSMSGAISFGSSGGSRLDQGRYDSSRGGLSGISLVCSLDYDFNWQAGWVTSLQQDRLTPRPLYIDSNAGTTLKLWNPINDHGIEISHTGITFPDNTTQTTAFTGNADSSSWDTTHTTVQSNSANWSDKTSYADANFLPLSGGTVTGNLTAVGNVDLASGYNTTTLFVSQEKVGINTIAPTEDLTVIGNAFVSGSVSTNNIRIGNSETVSGFYGTITRKIEIFDQNGVSLGFLPIYNSID